MKFIQRIYYWFQRQSDKRPCSFGIAKLGQWRVRYPDGEYARKSTYDVAVGYKEIFGGEIIWTRHQDPCKG